MILRERAIPLKAVDIFLTGDGESSLQNAASSTETGLGCSSIVVASSAVIVSSLNLAAEFWKAKNGTC